VFKQNRRRECPQTIDELIGFNESTNYELKEQDIISVLQPHNDAVLSIQSAKVDADVAFYVRQCLDNDPTLWRCKPITEEVVKALVDGTDGMYNLCIISVMILGFDGLCASWRRFEGV
jgi:hypothetical protein